MKLEEGMYVRTKYNGISKIVDCINDPTHYFFKCYKLDRDYTNCEEYITEKDVLKASHNIVDLLEVGDVITTNNLCGEVTKIDIENNKIWIACCDYETYRIEDVKSIVTKEQMESMKYEVE